MIKRRHQRVDVPNLVAHLSYGVSSFTGTVSNISRTGILLTDIPEEFDTRGEELSIIVSGKGKDFKLLVVPKWVSEDNSKKRMGMVIPNAPIDWTVFAMKYELKNEDIWAATTNLPDYF